MQALEANPTASLAPPSIAKKPRKRGPGRPFQKGNNANPNGRPKNPTLAHVNIPEDRIKQSEIIRRDAFEIAALAGQELLTGLRMPGKKNEHDLRQKSWYWGVAADKVLKDDDRSAQVRTPAIILDRLMILVSGDTANHVDVMPRPLETTEQSTPCAVTGSEPS